MLPFTRPGIRVAAVLAVLLAGTLGAGTAASAPPAPAQVVLPPPLRFVASLDLECFPAPGPQLPITTGIVTRHLNPVLAHLPPEQTPIGAREQLCVPVAKNNMIPPPEVLAFIRFVDLACYRTTGTSLNQQLRLDHLNPLFSSLPTRSLTILSPVQLCLPVMKNGLAPPPEVRRLVSFIDLKCYVETPQVALNRTITLTQLNPVLGHIPPANATVTFNRQLCLPVQKNAQQIPPDVLNIVQWVDLEKYDIVTPPLPAPVSLILNHLNPMFAGLPAEQATISQGRQLMLPVAKNNTFPPIG